MQHSESSATKDRRELIRRLMLAFPMGATEDRIPYYLSELQDIPLLELAGGIARAGQTLETSRIPPVATIRRLVAEQKSETLQIQIDTAKLEEPKGRALTEDELDQCMKVRELARAGWFWCCYQGLFVEAEPRAQPVAVGRWARLVRGKGTVSGWNAKHKSADQTVRMGVDPIDVTREKIHDTHARVCGESVFD